ncbi:MAG: hypothetical protein R3Y39_08815 [Rikenellaceae bacterium]
MEDRIIKISDNGVVDVPSHVSMSDFEIAQLLGVMLPTVRGCIKRLLKSRMILDCSGGEVSGNRIIPTHFGLDVIIAIAFQVESYQANIFRKWVMTNITNIRTSPPIFISLPSDTHLYN